MHSIKIISLIIIAGLLSGCGATVRPVLSMQPSYVSEAKVQAGENKVTVNLPEDLRYKVMREASRYSSTGRPKTIKIVVTNFNVKNPLQSWLIGDANRIFAKVSVVDKQTGKVEQTYDTFYQNAGMLQGIAGAVLSAIDNPVDVEQELTAGLAKKILEQLYGPKKAEIAATRKYAAHIKPNYPRNYDELKVEVKCKMAYENSKIQVDKSQDPMEIGPSEECEKYWPKKKRRRYSRN